MIQIHSIQRKDEKILFTIAVISSALIWLIPIFIVVNAYQPKTLEGLCIWYDDEYEEYVFEKMEMIEPELVQYCLKNEDVPTEEIAGMMAKLQRDDLENVLLFAVFFAYFIAFVGFMYVAQAIAIAHIRLNGVKLSPTQCPTFYKLYKSAAERLEISTVPPAYLIDSGGVANAFAILIARKKTIVFFSELVERLNQEGKMDELKAICGHELTHLKLKHINYGFFLMPFRLLPFLSRYYSRLCELSADRGALFVVKNTEVASQALLKLAVGTAFNSETNIEEYCQASAAERGFFSHAARLLATHPPIPQRIQELKKISK